KQFQVDGTILQLMKKDGIIHSGTGSGKTAIVAGPYVYPENSHKVTIMVSPLMALQADMATAFQDKYKLPAIVINSSLGSNLTKVIEDVIAGKYRIILISPESLLSRRIRDELLSVPEFAKTVLSMVLDEAHCVSFWSLTFRKKYGTLHIARDYLPDGVSLICLSATLSARVLRDIIQQLHIKTGYIYINTGNERPNTSIVVRPCKFPLKSHKNLAFVIDPSVRHPLDTPKTFVYVDSKTEGYAVVAFLNALLPAQLRYTGIIRPFNARHSTQYRTDAMHHFKLGNIRVLVCTDAAGMGCDISDIERVVQWRVTSFSALIQRWGRVAQSPTASGIAVLLVERSAYNYNPTEPGSKEIASTKSSKSGQNNMKQRQKEPLKQGGFQSEGREQPELRDNSPLEGTLVLVQTRDCRRKVWTEMFRNTPAAPTVPCCDLCEPALLEQLGPPKASRFVSSGHKRAPKKGEPHRPSQEVLVAWRQTIWQRDFSLMSWGPSGVLSDDLIDILTTIGPLKDPEELKKLLAHRWGLWDRYGKEL
ncbi:P-loop containing nucleoside triphosphate hydrolase protein, partial [Ceratobasidium sp. AG-I]